jgi:hypothetical protein
MVEVSLKQLVYAVPPILGEGMFNTWGLIGGLVLSVMAYQIQLKLFTPLPVRDALPYVDTSPVSVPKGAEPMIDAIEQLNRLQTECISDCSNCKWMNSTLKVPCVLWGSFRDLIPAQDPYITIIERNTALTAQNNQLLALNNKLRRAEELRSTPWLRYIQVAMTAGIMFVVTQILAFVVASL